jgi:hypothetical protein
MASSVPAAAATPHAEEQEEEGLRLRATQPPRELSAEQLRHFAEHGWVIQEDAFTAEECALFRQALDRLDAREYCPGPHSWDGGDIHNIDNQINSGEEIFLDWITHPHILPVLWQLLGAPPTFEGCHAMIKHPHPLRHDRAEAAKLADPETFGWHRGMRPKWGMVDSDLGPGFANTTFLNNCTYLTDIDSELDGGTAILDGSHLTDTGDPSADKQAHLHTTYKKITKIKAGSVVHFTECTIHSGVPVLSERTRYTMFYGFTPPWQRVWKTPAGDSGPSQEVIDAAEGVLKDILAPDHNYGGQYDVAKPKL